MREIKFRVFDKVKEEMINPSGGACMDVSQTQGVDRWVFGIDLFNHPDDVEIMQYTGLKDKNGKEVYEGDIVTCSVGCLHEVYWRDAQPFMGIGGWGLRGISNDYDWIGSDEEVVGNIYDNGDLIRASQLAEGV